MPIDRWILHELYVLQQQVMKAYTDYEFHKIYHWLHEFCVVQLSAVYLDIFSKDRMYCSGATSPGTTRRPNRPVLDRGTELPRMAAPILVFTSEEAYLQLDKAGAQWVCLRSIRYGRRVYQPELAKSGSDCWRCGQTCDER